LSFCVLRSIFRWFGVKRAIHTRIHHHFSRVCEVLTSRSSTVASGPLLPKLPL